MYISNMTVDTYLTEIKETTSTYIFIYIFIYSRLISLYVDSPLYITWFVMSVDAYLFMSTHISQRALIREINRRTSHRESRQDR